MILNVLPWGPNLSSQGDRETLNDSRKALQGLSVNDLSVIFHFKQSPYSHSVSSSMNQEVWTRLCFSKYGHETLCSESSQVTI